MRRWWIATALLGALTGMAGRARAAEPATITSESATITSESATITSEPATITSEPATIVGGSPSQPCDWPSVVALRTGGLCTATLVHPRILVYAAHCGTLHSRALFGEDVDAPARELPLLRCERFSDLFAVSSMDFAYCELTEPVEDVAITPLLWGCDEALIEVGTPVTIVGFGDSTSVDPPVVGLKHAAETTIVQSTSLVWIGGMGIGADSGDSGGPALVQLGDGSWRVLGIVSGGGGDGATVQYVPAPDTVAWIEDRSGVDITPCHASDGSWAPTPRCQDMFVSVDPGASWAEGCPGPSSAPSQRCGPAWTEQEPDGEAPIVAFVEPQTGVALGPGPVVIDVEVTAEDLPATSVGVRDLRLFVDGEPWIDALGRVAVDEVPPYLFVGVELDGDGAHSLSVEARDHHDNVATAAIEVVVGDGSAETGGTEADTGAEGTGDSGTEDGGTEDDGGPTDGGGRGCGCAQSRDPGPWGWLAAVFGFWWMRRRDPEDSTLGS